MNEDDRLQEKVGSIMRDLYPVRPNTPDITVPTDRPTSGSRRGPVVISIVGVAILVVIVSAFVFYRAGDSHRSAGTVPAAGAATSSSAGPNDQTCPSDSNAASTLVVSTSGSADNVLSAPCYVAPANTPLTIRFENDLPASPDGQRLPVRLVITTVDKPVSRPIPGAPGGYVGTNEGAIYSSTAITGQASLDVPALPAGTYLIQLLPGISGQESRLVVG